MAAVCALAVLAAVFVSGRTGGSTGGLAGSLAGLPDVAVLSRQDGGPAGQDVGLPAPTARATSQGLTPGMRAAFDAARAAMLPEGIEMRLTSGFRTREHQQELYDEAVAKYGSPEAARTWVLPPEESQHVRGLAVDVAPREAARWLDENGARFGLCRTMEWEWWHFEHRPAWERTGTCPAPRRR